MKLLCVLFAALIFCILTHSGLSMSYAALGLELWFQKMIPALLPFMILSGVMVRLKLTEKTAMVIYPVLNPLFRISKNVCYAILMGFLCGFPMGARVVSELYSRQMISKREAEYLLAFCNNIGPVYFCSFALPLLGRKQVLPYLFGMYGIPLLYGLILRYTFYHDIEYHDISYQDRKSPRDTVRGPIPHRAGAEMVCCESAYTPSQAAKTPVSVGKRLLEALDDSIQAAVQSMLTLGGYMILFNLLNLIPHLLLHESSAFFAPLLEITGGLSMLLHNAALYPDKRLVVYSLLALSFGGSSCIAQTYTCVRESKLSVTAYIFHKIILTLLNGLFYICWFAVSPSSFLL